MTFRIALLLMLPGLALSGPVMAQVQVNPGALDKLAPTAPATTTPGTAPAGTAQPGHKHPAPRQPPAHRPARGAHHPAPAHPEAPSPAAAKPAAHPAAQSSSGLAPAAPPSATLATEPPGPPAKPLPPPVIPVLPDAVNDVSSITEGIRIGFPAGKSDLSPAAVTALNNFSKALAGQPDLAINVYGYAAGAPDDPSTPRRLSLSRALAARTVLLTNQIASTRIYVRALGGTPSDGPPDRVDVQLARAAGKAAPPTPPAPSPAPRTP